MKTLVALSLAVFLTTLMSPKLQAEEELKKLEKQTQEAVGTFKSTDPNITNLFAKSAGYAVFPRVGKGGFIIGGAHGEGLVYQKSKLIGRAAITQVTVGAQIGGQELSEIIFFETPEALNEFKKSGCTMSAQVSAVAAAEGASENAKYMNGVMVFTKARTGLMAEASVGGQKITFEPIKK